MMSVAAPVPGCESCAYTSGERRAPGGRVYENEHWLVEHVGSPWVTGTMVVKTKAHREALSVRARMVLLQGDLDHAQAAQAASKVRDYLAVH